MKTPPFEFSPISIFWLWLNDTTPDRYYWSGTTWTHDYAQAEKYPDRAAAVAARDLAAPYTKAEIMIQEYRPHQ